MPASSLDRLEVNVPKAWEELNEGQLLYILRYLAAGIDANHVQVYAFLRFAGLGVVRQQRGALIVRKGWRIYPLSREEVTLGAMALNFINEPPPIPQRPERWGGVQAVNAEMHGVPFGQYLQIENYLQQYLQQPDDRLLLPMARLLYPGIKKWKVQSKVFRYIIVHWMTGLKMHFSHFFPNLYRPAPTADGLPDLREAMLAQIRALTSGDVTKEERVLNVDTWTALAELDAKAREARELEKMYKK